MTETLSTVSSQDSYNHFDEVPQRLDFQNAKGEFVEVRSENNPDLVLLLVGFGEQPEVMQLRQQYDAHIARNPEIQQMFYRATPPEDVHSTIHRIDLLSNVPHETVDDLIHNLNEGFAEFEKARLWYGKNWVVGDGILSEITSDQGDPVRIMRKIASEALVSAGLPGCDGEFISHSTDRYAKQLQKDKRPEIGRFLEEAAIEPTEIDVLGLYVAVNWPEHDTATSYGTYKYKVIDFIPFAGVSKEEGLAAVSDKIVLPQ